MEDYITKQYQPYLDKMEDTPLKSYIVERIIDQIKWYDKKSTEKQSRYKRLTIASVILNAAIPITVLLSDNNIVIKLLVATLSSASGAITAIIAVCGYKDLWVQYRSNCELLKSTLHRFFLCAGEFRHLKDDDNALLDALVVCCEEYLTKEFQTWVVVTNGENSTVTKKH